MKIHRSLPLLLLGRSAALLPARAPELDTRIPAGCPGRSVTELQAERQRRQVVTSQTAPPPTPRLRPRVSLLSCLIPSSSSSSSAATSCAARPALGPVDAGHVPPMKLVLFRPEPSSARLKFVITSVFKVDAGSGARSGPAGRSGVVEAGGAGGRCLT